MGSNFKTKIDLIFLLSFILVIYSPSSLLADDHDEIRLKPYTQKSGELHHLIDNTANDGDGIEFKCVQIPGENGWRPQSTRKRGYNGNFPALGRLPIPTKEICEKIVAASKNGVVCSNTGVAPFYKPTHFSGSTEYRKDFGFWGSSTTLDSCLVSTRNSSSEKICYWGGEGWFVGDIKGSKKNFGGDFKTVQDCVKSYEAN